MRLTQWLAMVCGFSAAGTLLGWGIGMLLAVLSGDYVVMPADQAWLGLRLGLFAGTVVAAGCVVRPPSRWSMRSLGPALGIATFAASCALCLFGAFALLLPFDFLPVEEVQLAHPRRHAVFLAIHHAWPYALLFGIIAGGLRLWRIRPS